ncbi:Enoyl-CoA hydratase/carnithine racemase [Noviherbaspirillum humi]|uniref:Enoyl-CoA hydratase/carnithine racemase n=1 Tax=Noviherbaspirillum humi TaxID=1688639 RepID=A0A239IY95_9BURK|nr:enoyl-CoA hydratase-related protein [Noviherbaspirillum humi]SNS98495.1 Enoyl-CoA hydratase/carnithine racemase [Noviherbaspirillum humi]
MAEILVETEGTLAIVSLSNPGKMNAIDVAMWRSLAQVFNRLSNDDSLRCVILRGSDGNFAAGADIEEFPSVRNSLEQGIRYHTEIMAQALDAIAGCRHPTLAAIEGVCVGGGLELACACDIRIASPQARFGIPIGRLGFALAPGELQPLLQLVGKAAALEILLEGRIFEAAEAKEKGLLQRVVDHPVAEARHAAARISRGAPLAARMHKKMISRLCPAPEPLTEEEMRDGLSTLASDDYREGVASFLEKRPPNFSGK